MIIDQPKKTTNAAKSTSRDKFNSKTAPDELFLMDSYYKELIKKERAAFERVLASKLNV